MKRCLPIVFALGLLSLACSLSQGGTAYPTPTAPPVSKGRCGDGVCDGPETAASCPDDCAETVEPVAADVPPVYFFYVIHTHASGDHLPYETPAMQTINPQTADNMLAAIEGIAEVLDRHGVKGTWEVVYGTAKGLCAYGGEAHVFRRLQAGGHEVGAHAHRIDDVDTVFQTLRDDCGITPRTTSGFVTQISADDAQATMSLALRVPVDLGMTVGTSNLSPGGGQNPFGDLCGNTLGVGNDMWAQSGNLMFPWRPDYQNRDICADSLQGEMVLVDHVSIEWLILPGEAGPPDVLADAHFDQLRGYFDGALQYAEKERPERVMVWGFVTHITEYAPGSKGERLPDPAALAALDRFLAYVDAKRAEGRVIYVTASEAAGLAFSEE